MSDSPNLRNAVAARVGMAALENVLRRVGLRHTGEHPDINFERLEDAPFPTVRIAKPGCAPITFSFEQYLNVGIGPFFEQVMTEVRDASVGHVEADIERLLRSKISIRRSWLALKLIMIDPDGELWETTTMAPYLGGSRKRGRETFEPYVA